jgi:hypothetical protein
MPHRLKFLGKSGLRRNISHLERSRHNISLERGSYCLLLYWQLARPSLPASAQETAVVNSTHYESKMAAWVRTMRTALCHATSDTPGQQYLPCPCGYYRTAGSCFAREKAFHIVGCARGSFSRRIGRNQGFRGRTGRGITGLSGCQLAGNLTTRFSLHPITIAICLEYPDAGIAA